MLPWGAVLVGIFHFWCFVRGKTPKWGFFLPGPKYAGKTPKWGFFSEISHFRGYNFWKKKSWRGPALVGTFHFWWLFIMGDFLFYFGAPLILRHFWFWIHLKLGHFWFLGTFHFLSIFVPIYMDFEHETELNFQSCSASIILLFLENNTRRLSNQYQTNSCKILLRPFPLNEWQSIFERTLNFYF